MRAEAIGEGKGRKPVDHRLHQGERAWRKRRKGGIHRREGGKEGGTERQGREGMKRTSAVQKAGVVGWLHPLDTEYRAVNPGPGAGNKDSKLLRLAAGGGGGRG